MMEDFKDNKCIVQTRDGPICGYIDRSDDGTFYKFKKIPFAKPPVGNLRFMPPIAINPWTDILDCTQNAPLPIHANLKDEIVGSEDCLYLEVTSTNIKPNKLMPVMFWIGSYNYAFEMNDICDPTLITKQDIVFVRCGSRLGVLGFLSINDFIAPGNSGLKDIVLALQWVQKNISVFGGDPNNVTLFGSCSGGSTVHLMMLSPMARGLFHKGIIQSSTALNRSALASNPVQSVIEFAKLLGITKTDLREIVEELKNIPAEKIVKTYLATLDHDNEDMFDAMFKPSVESEFEGQPIFLNKIPGAILRSGNFYKVPMIIGCNNVEAAVLQYVNSDFYADFEKFNKDVSLLVPKSLSLDCENSEKIGQQLLNFYFKDMEGLTEHSRTQYLQLLSDYYFLYHVNKTVRLHSRFAPDSPIYYYSINYAGEWDLPKELSFLNSSGHGGDIAFLFRIKSPGVECCKGSRDSVITRNRVIRMWTNFAKYGNPTPDEDDPLLQIKWDPVVNENTLNYLSIGSELTKGRNPFSERMLFWEQLFKEHTLLRTLLYFNDIGVSWYSSSKITNKFIKSN